MPDWFVPLLQVLMIDIVLAGDNAIVVGMAAAGLPPTQRRTAVLWGIGAATLMRIGFAAITTQLLAIVGLTLAGGVLLAWVCWKMFRELRNSHAVGHEHDTAMAPGVS
ncbi:MAG: TerC family protein, partial [Rhodospirillales bacterium]|nr:TerC family protein [Rhodospirillales bacterium]